MITYPIQTVEKVNGVVTNANYTSFEVHDGIVSPLNTYQLELTSPVTNLTNSITSGQFDSRYKLHQTLRHDANGNIKSISNVDGVELAFIWGYGNQYPIARVENASPEYIFHTSFENDGELFISGNVNLAKTGRRVWNSGSFSFTGKFAPPNTTGLKMSYWFWNGTAWVFSGVVAYNNTISAGQKLDEIRVYPASARMTTYTFDPLIGITTITDANNEVSYFNYDSNGRLKNVLDDEGNLVKAIDYNYQN